MRIPDRKIPPSFRRDREPNRRTGDAATTLQKEQARRLLPALIGRMCLEIYDRNWVPELPYTLWETVNGSVSGLSEFRAEEIALFRMLTQISGGWVRYDADQGPVFTSRGKWLQTYTAWKRGRGRARKRLTAA
jgi:hypothetical protein